MSISMTVSKNHLSRVPHANIHPHTVSDLYIVLLKSAVSNPATTGHGREGFYFGENGEHSLFEISQEISKVLVELGKGKSAEPTTFSEEEVVKYFGVRIVVYNRFCDLNPPPLFRARISGRILAAGQNGPARSGGNR
jgi:hypothetical protein